MKKIHKLTLFSLILIVGICVVPQSAEDEYTIDFNELPLIDFIHEVGPHHEKDLYL